MSRHLHILVISGLLVGCGPYDPKVAGDLAKCYEAEFGTPPPAGVIVLEARQMVIRDWGAQWLKIRAETNLIDSVLLRGFKEAMVPPAEFRGSKSRYTPDWWVLPPAKELEFYECNQWTRGNWSFSHAGLAVHRASNTVYFNCSRVD